MSRRFPHTVFEQESLLHMLMALSEQVGKRLRSKGLRGPHGCAQATLSQLCNDFSADNARATDRCD